MLQKCLLSESNLSFCPPLMQQLKNSSYRIENTLSTPSLGVIKLESLVDVVYIELSLEICEGLILDIFIFLLRHVNTQFINHYIYYHSITRSLCSTNNFLKMWKKWNKSNPKLLSIWIGQIMSICLIFFFLNHEIIFYFILFLSSN